MPGTGVGGVWEAGPLREEQVCVCIVTTHAHTHIYVYACVRFCRQEFVFPI